MVTELYAHTINCLSLATMRITPICDHYAYKSPILGLNSCNNQKLDDTTITQASYRPHQHQKNLVRFRDKSSVAKNLKYECYMNEQSSATQDAFTAPFSKEEQLPSLSNGEPGWLRHQSAIESSNINRKVRDHQCISKHIKPDERTETKQATTCSWFQPVPLHYLENKTLPILSHHQMTVDSGLGIRVPDLSMKSEYSKKFVENKVKTREDALEKGIDVRNLKSHNIITGVQLCFSEIKNNSYS